MTSNNLCSSCTNMGCEFQSGIVRTECAFYMPPHIEPDNCGNYAVIQPTVNVLDKIRAEIKTKYDSIPWRNNDYDDGWIEALEWVFDDVLDKYKAERMDT